MMWRGHAWWCCGCGMLACGNSNGQDETQPAHGRDLADEASEMGICFSCETEACLAAGGRTASIGVHGNGSQAQIDGVADCDGRGNHDAGASATPLSCLRIPLQGIEGVTPHSLFPFVPLTSVPSARRKERERHRHILAWTMFRPHDFMARTCLYDWEEDDEHLR